MKYTECVMILEKARRAIAIVQRLPPMPIYSVESSKDILNVSGRTIKRRLAELEALGLAKYSRDMFTLKREVIYQPSFVLEYLVPSLLALKKAKTFGRHYNMSDINFMKRHLPTGSIITLEHAAYALTKFQTPSDLHVYVDDMERMSEFLKKHGFCEGKQGNVILLPKIGTFENIIERIFLDSVAYGGRSILDAGAIMFLYKDKINTHIRFSDVTMQKVQEDVPLHGTNY